MANTENNETNQTKYSNFAYKAFVEGILGVSSNVAPYDFENDTFRLLILSTNYEPMLQFKDEQGKLQTVLSYNDLIEKEKQENGSSETTSENRVNLYEIYNITNVKFKISDGGKNFPQAKLMSLIDLNTKKNEVIYDNMNTHGLSIGWAVVYRDYIAVKDGTPIKEGEQQKKVEDLEKKFLVGFKLGNIGPIEGANFKINFGENNIIVQSDGIV